MKENYQGADKKKSQVLTLRVKYSSALPGRADAVVEYLKALKEIFGSLFSDENFLTLLQAEGRTEIPEFLAVIAERARTGDEIR